LLHPDSLALSPVFKGRSRSYVAINLLAHHMCHLLSTFSFFLLVFKVLSGAANEGDDSKMQLEEEVARLKKQAAETEEAHKSLVT
jgi:hypothetical protein